MAWLVYPELPPGMCRQKCPVLPVRPGRAGLVRVWAGHGDARRAAGDSRPADPDLRVHRGDDQHRHRAAGRRAAAGDCCGTDGEPVNLTTGLFTLEQTDVALPDVLPIAITRSYRTRDPEIRPFGRGMTHPYAMFLWSAHEFTEADLILPDGGRIHYVRTSAGTSNTDAVFEHVERPNPPPGEQPTSATPTAFYRSVMRWNGRGWDIRLKDGTVYVFGETAPLQAIRDRYGNTITITHQYDQTGPITRVTSPHGRWFEFSYTRIASRRSKTTSGGPGATPTTRAMVGNIG